MSKVWEYPIYLVPHGGGYASIVDPQCERSTQLLAVFTAADLSMQFMMRFSILATPRPIHNDREFGWLLQSLQAPVTKVVFDPAPVEESINPRWQFAVDELLQRHLTRDYSPWNYPVFVVAQETGFLSINGQTSAGQEIVAIGVFTLREKVEEYLAASGETGTLCEITNIEDARAFLSGLDEQVVAVALNPQFVEGRYTARHCFELTTILDKYLASDADGVDPSP